MGRAGRVVPRHRRPPRHGAPVAEPPHRAGARLRRRRAHQRGELRPRRGGRAGRRTGDRRRRPRRRGADVLRPRHAPRDADRLRLGRLGRGRRAGPGRAPRRHPEQLVLGIGIAAGEGVGVGLLVAIFVSNLPEAIGASNDLVAAGRSPRAVRFLWLVVAVVCTLATVVGFAIADTTSGDLRAAINGFAAGALLVMLIDSMIPEGARKAKRPAGRGPGLGFAAAAGLPGVSGPRPPGVRERPRRGAAPPADHVRAPWAAAGGGAMLAGPLPAPPRRTDDRTDDDSA